MHLNTEFALKKAVQGQLILEDLLYVQITDQPFDNPQNNYVVCTHILTTLACLYKSGK